MNPQDLLYTNSFVGTNEINFNENQRTRDRINVLKTIDRPFPKKYNRNWEPIISEEVRDIVKDRYKKYKTTSLLLDSCDRNYAVYPKPNNYKLILGNQFNYIESIKLLSINLNNMFLTKTEIAWLSNNGTQFSTEIPCGIYSSNNLANIISQYMSMVPDEDGNIQNIDVKIDPIINDVRIVNRVQIPEIVAIQTLIQSTDDIFTPSVVAPVQNGIYILVKQDMAFNNYNLPIVPTNIPNIGGYSNILFNYREFWQGNTNGNQYMWIDQVIIGGTNYQRYLLIPKVNSYELRTKTPQNIITTMSIVSYLTADVINKRNFISNFNEKELESLPKIGEAREFAINFNESSLMDVFNWRECDEEFRYILTNNTSYNISKNKCFDIYKDWCDYMFKVEPYILLKLTVPSYAGDTIAGNLVKSQNLPKKMIYDCNEMEDTTNIFAKICIDRENSVETSILKFYETPLEKFDEIIITFLDRNGKILDLKCDQTIMLEVVEAVDVLKDTLIDSRHGEANITGIRY
jgi:hypothetical protein